MKKKTEDKYKNRLRSNNRESWEKNYDKLKV